MYLYVCDTQRLLATTYLDNSHKSVEVKIYFVLAGCTLDGYPYQEGQLFPSPTDACSTCTCQVRTLAISAADVCATYTVLSSDFTV